MAAKKKFVMDYAGDPPREIKEKEDFYGFELDEHQLKFANAIWSPDYDIIFANCKAGSGKAQPLDTVIPTPTGPTLLGDIRAGDFVFDAHGRPTKVLAVFPQGKQRAYKVTFNDGRSTICAGEHLWTYYGRSKQMVTETLNSMMKRSVLMGNGQGARYNIPINGAVEYEHKVFEIDPYVIGVFLGDGCCTDSKLTLSSNDEELVSEIARLTGYTYKRRSQHNYCWDFFDNGKYVNTKDFFKNYPEVRCLCGKKRIPSQYLYGSVEQRLSLLQGLMDTDGGITYAGGRNNICFTTSSLDLLNDMLQLIYSLGFTGSIYRDYREKYKNGVVYSIHFRVFPSFKENIFRLGRKKEKAREAKRSDNRRKYDRLAIHSIEDLDYECDMVCIYVDNDEHLYLTNDFIVTHNTLIAAGVANLLVQYGFYRNIVYIMSPYGDRKQGWLPGSITEKSSVYFEAFYQALVKCNVQISTAINTESMVNQKNGTGYITCITDTYLRGSTLDNAVIIIDEAQNYTVSQLKTVLTRVGNNSKVVVIGHDLQCDLDEPSKSGFKDYIEHFSGQERTAFCSLVNNYRSWISRHADELEQKEIV